jgi:hypothetical protein
VRGHHRFVHDQGWTIATDGRGRFSFTPPDAAVVPASVPLPGAVVPELVFPEWPGEHDPELDPWDVWHPPLQPRGAVARPDYDACLFVLSQELERNRPPDEIEVAA